MKNKVAFYASIFISLFTLVLILVFKTTPQSQLWKGYKIIYVPNTIDSSFVEKTLESANIEGVISKSNQKPPVVSKFAPVQIQTTSSYLLRREGFFTDKSNAYNTFYVPEKYSQKIPSVLDLINKSLPDKNLKAGTDGEGRISIFPPLIAIIAFLAALYFCENKFAFSALAVSPLIFAIANPFFCVTGSFLLSLVAFYAVQKIYKRKGALSVIQRSVFCYIFLILPGILLCFSYIKLSLFYFLAVISSLANFYLFTIVSDVVESKFYSFNPSLILSAKTIKLPGKQGLNILKSCAISVFVLFITSFFAGGSASGSSMPNASSSNIFLPMPVSKTTSGELPNANDFSIWAWNTLSFPFKKLSKTQEPNSQNVPKECEKIVFSGVTPLDDKIFSSSYNTLVYNNSFRQSLYKSADGNEESVEHLMLTQGEKTNFAYGKQTGSTNERFRLILLSCFLFASVGATLYYSFRK